MRSILSLFVLGFMICALPFFGAAAEPPTPPPADELPALIDALLGEDAKAVGQAQLTLLGKGAAASPALRARLEKAEGDEAYRLIMVMSRINDPELTKVFKQVWEKSPKAEVKMAAAMALCRLNVEYDRFLDFIARHVQEGEEDQRLEAMQMLGYIGDARVVDPLKKIFYDQKQTDFVRQAAVWDLAHTPAPESARVLVEMLGDPEVDWFYKEIILTALRQLARNKELVPVISEGLEKIQRLPLPPIPAKP